MNISGVSTSTTSSSYTSQTQTSSTGYTFSQIMESSRNAQTAKTSASSDAAARAVSVRDSLDTETLAQLDKYTEIYNKYAAIYGDGFEITRTQFGNGSASDAAEMKHAEARGAFYTELYGAGIPGCERLLTVEDVSIEDLRGGSYTFLNPTDGYWKEKYNTNISALFYTEKYGLAGLSKEEQCQAILGGLKTSTADDMAAAAQMLYSIGAISAYESREIGWQTSMYAGQSVGPNATRAELISAQRDTLFDWSTLLDKLENKELYDLISRAWDAQEDDTEGEKLNAIIKKVDTQQEAIHEAIELSNQKRRERELLDRATAENTRLRIMFGLDNGLNVDAVDMVQDTAETVMSVL